MRKSNHNVREAFLEARRRLALPHTTHDHLAPVNRHMRRRLKALASDED